MSEALEKAAAYSPESLALISFLTGGGTFAGLRLMSDLHQQLHPLNPNQNKIKLELPNPRRPIPVQPDITDNSAMQLVGSDLAKTSGDVSGAPSNFSYWAAAMGLPVGFLGAKTLYDAYQNHQGNQQIDQAKKQYEHELALAQQTNGIKLAEGSTPNVDLFCEAMATELEKNANMLSSVWAKAQPQFNTNITPSQLMSHIQSQPMNYLDQSEGMNAIKGGAKHLFARTADAATGHGYSTSKDILGAIVAASGVGTLGFLIKNQLNKQKKEMKATYPTGVEYAQ